MYLGKWGRRLTLGATLLFVAGCASMNRSCSTFNAESFGADWVIAQYDMNGRPFLCWKLQNVSVANEESSDGIHWAEGTLGHLVHISGWYNRVQVARGDFESAATRLGVDASQCDNGHYPAHPELLAPQATIAAAPHSN